MLAAYAFTRLLFRRLLKMLELDFRPYPPFLLCNRLFEFVGELLLQSCQLLLVVFFSLLQ